MITSLLLLINLGLVFSTVCDESYECEATAITDVALCYGYHSCDGATIFTSEYISCSGYYGCYQATQLVTTEYIYCNGAYGCYGAKEMTTSSNIVCNGEYSCSKVDGIMQADANIDCLGDSSCTHTTIRGDETFCNGNFACRDSDITAGNNFIYFL